MVWCVRGWRRGGVAGEARGAGAESCLPPEKPHAETVHNMLRAAGRGGTGLGPRCCRQSHASWGTPAGNPLIPTPGGHQSEEFIILWIKGRRLELGRSAPGHSARGSLRIPTTAPHSCQLPQVPAAAGLTLEARLLLQGPGPGAPAPPEGGSSRWVREPVSILHRPLRLSQGR